MLITPLYAAVLAIAYVALSIRTLRIRRRLRIAIGDGGSEEMLRAMRTHANFAEYVPFAVLLIALAELQGAGAAWLHALGVALLAGRGAHAWGVSRSPEDYRFRVAGMTMTFLTLLGAATLMIATPFVR
jgi:uncharacterized membrane protein YecN with MAPEG domain